MKLGRKREGIQENLGRVGGGNEGGLDPNTFYFCINNKENI